MDRRESLKFLAFTALSGSLLTACNNDEKKATLDAAKAGDPEVTIDRYGGEAAADKALMEQTFFTPAEMGTLEVLSNIIIPADEVSGSATDAGVPAFIEFMVKDKPNFQTPMRGGLRWLDMYSIKQFGKRFSELSNEQQISIVDKIAYPAEATADVQPGVSFFNLMRNLTATGFYSSEQGIKDLGYMGNRPNQWNGVPADVLQKYGLAYTEKELQECVSYS